MKKYHIGQDKLFPKGERAKGIRLRKIPNWEIVKATLEVSRGNFLNPPSLKKSLIKSAPKRRLPQIKIYYFVVKAPRFFSTVWFRSSMRFVWKMFFSNLHSMASSSLSFPARMKPQWSDAANVGKKCGELPIKYFLVLKIGPTATQTHQTINTLWETHLFRAQIIQQGD